MTEAQHHDWPKIIREIKYAGLSIYRIAALCHVDKNTVRSWETGTEPRYTAGVLLLELHEDMCSDVPHETK